MNLGGFYDARPGTTVLVGVSRGERGTILSASPTLAALVACSPDELPGATLLDYVHPDDQRRAAYEFARLVNRRSATFDGVGRLRARDGAVHWLSTHANLVEIGGSEQLLIRGFVLPVRLLAADEASRRRTSGTDKLHVALDLEPVEAC